MGLSTNTRLNSATLVDPKENLLLVSLFIFSVLVWGVLAVTIVGVVYVLLVGAVLWFGNGLLVASLRSGAVEVTDKQMPELYVRYKEIAKQLGILNLPKLYILESAGLLNAFATRHAGRDFVVIYSDFVEGFGPGSDEVAFILGHELGHIERKHLLKRMLVAPGLLLPLLGAAYSRACEHSCDRYGAFVANNQQASLNAVMALAGGRYLAKQYSAEAFASQYQKERGFFVSLHEVTSGYPTLAQRAAQVQSYGQDAIPFKPAKRNPLAYLFGIFSFGGGAKHSIITTTIVLLIVLFVLIAPKLEQWQQEAKAINEVVEQEREGSMGTDMFNTYLLVELFSIENQEQLEAFLGQLDSQQSRLPANVDTSFMEDIRGLLRQEGMDGLEQFKATLQEEAESGE